MEKKKFNGVLIFAIVGLFIAASFFLITFITTQKADEPTINYEALKVAKKIAIPTPPALPPLKGELPENKTATSEGIIISPSIVPIESPTTQSAIIASPAASINP